MNMRRLEGDTERTITADELCNRVVPLQRGKRLTGTLTTSINGEIVSREQVEADDTGRTVLGDRTAEWPAMGVEPKRYSLSAAVAQWFFWGSCVSFWLIVLNKLIGMVAR